MYHIKNISMYTVHSTLYIDKDIIKQGISILTHDCLLFGSLTKTANQTRFVVQSD